MAASRDNSTGVKVRWAPDSQAAIEAGIAVLERTLGPTLGPAGRPVAIAPIGRPGQPPELLDDGATIARRMIGIPDRFENMGFMMARQAAWAMRKTAGDGATTSVLILAEAHRRLRRYAAAGASRVALLAGAQCATEQAIAMLMSAAGPLQPHHLNAYAAMVAGNPDVARVVVQALDLLGPGATIVTRSSTGTTVHLELVEGALWESTANLTPLMETSGAHIRLSKPTVLLWDDAVADNQTSAQLLMSLKACEVASCLVIARSFSPAALGVIARNTASDFTIVPLRAPHAGRHQDWAFDDLAALTGARRLSPAAGDRASRVSANHLGTAQRAVIGPRFLNLMAPRSQSTAISRRIETLSAQMESCDEESEWTHLHLRLGRLQEGMGVIWVGAPSATERDFLLRRADRALGSVRAGLAGGVVPGGGATLLAIADAIRPPGTNDRDLGALAVAHALEAPARWIARNAGLDPGSWVERARGAAPGHGLDACTRSIVDLSSAGIVDPAPTVVHAVRTALSTATLAANCGVLIQPQVRLSQAEIRP